jgi:hypothetical protein
MWLFASLGGRDLAGVLRCAQDDRGGLLRDEEWGLGLWLITLLGDWARSCRGPSLRSG